MSNNTDSRIDNKIVDDNDVVAAQEMIKTFKWNIDDDEILKEWTDKSACFKWLHEKSYKIYKKQYLRLMIPVIVISTLTGAANFALERIPDVTYQGYASLIVGAFNIIAAIISTISQFLKTAELKEGHNIAARSWDKFNRTVKLELKKNPDERTPKRDVFTHAMKEYDRLVELSPDIPSKVIEEFKNIYKNSIDLIKPEITGYIMSSKIYEPKIQSVEENIIITQSTLDKEQVAKGEFIEKFKEKYDRMPTSDEINDFVELNQISYA
jgi:hypothetical protein